MSQAVLSILDSVPTATPADGAPTEAELDAMWFALRREEEDRETLATWKRQSGAAKRLVYGEAA